MKIKKGEKYELNGMFGKKIVKILRISKDTNNDIVVKYREGFPLFFVNELSGNSFKLRTLNEVEEADI